MSKIVLSGVASCDDTTSIYLMTPEAMDLGSRLIQESGKSFVQKHIPMTLKVKGIFTDKMQENPVEKELVFSGDTYISVSRKKPGIRFFLKLGAHGAHTVAHQSYTVEATI